jgi:hypothetical protein
MIITSTCASITFGGAQGFDKRTHVAITAEAAAKSVFSPSPYASSAWRTLGIMNPSLLRNQDYIDVGTQAKVRGANDIHESIIKEVGQAQTQLAIPSTYSLTGWLMQGAVREDDNAQETPQSDEPNGVFDRVFGHFFDPVKDRGLEVAGVRLGPRAVDWALAPGATVALLPGESATSTDNHFKISDAREAMWRALTLTAKDANGFGGNVWPSNSPNISAEALRQAYWATTFRALGDVMHLVQDMAQPQHTRNDRHSGRGCILLNSVCAAGHASFFEEYLRARTVRSGRFSLDEGFLGANPGEVRFTNAAQLTYAGYSVPRFNSYSDYFSTGLPGNNASGYGLANYSNRGFYSFGTNISSVAALDYPSPSPTGAGLTEVSVTGLADMTGTAISGSQVLLYGIVRDSVNPASDASNVALSSHGLWDQFLSERSFPKRYTLNHHNYDAQAELLIPRAVAYSAGIIDYFFRGKMDIGLPDSG